LRYNKHNFDLVFKLSLLQPVAHRPQQQRQSVLPPNDNGETTEQKNQEKEKLFLTVVKEAEMQTAADLVVPSASEKDDNKVGSW
jgi:hypothetical protein